MKQLFASILGTLSISLSLSAATIHIDNRIGTNETVIVSVITPTQTITQSIKPGGSTLVNSWVSGVTRFEWEIGGSKWSAPLEVKALQTEGTLSIEKDGNYTFKPCLLCSGSSGKAHLISLVASAQKAPISPTPQASLKGVAPTNYTPVGTMEPMTPKTMQEVASNKTEAAPTPSQQPVTPAVSEGRLVKESSPFVASFNTAEKVIMADNPSREDIAEAQAVLRTLIKKRSELSPADNDRLSDLNGKMLKRSLQLRN